jgi:type II secretory pathway pseudopilin PulG
MLKASPLGSTERATTSGFTLVELVALVLVFSLLALLAVPTLVRANQRTKAASCQSNLRQLGWALQAYAGAHAGYLPGPASPLAAAEYNSSSSNQLVWFLAERVGCAAPSLTLNVAPPFLCPARAAGATTPTAAQLRVDYTLNDGRALAAPPFGREGPTPVRPGTLDSITAQTLPATCVAIADADKGNVNPTLPGWSGLPYQPAHGQVRYQLYFDGHVASKHW